MEKKIVKKLGIILLAALLAACQKESAEAPKGEALTPLAPKQIEGVVTTTMTTGNYTYVEVETNGKKIWAAGPRTTVNVGDKISMPEGDMMAQFYAKSLDRTFDEILFTGAITVAGAPSAQPAAETASTPAPPASADAPAKGSIKKADKGFTVDEIFAKKGTLAGKAVALRAKVVKANQGIMGTNWYHLQDGSGEAGTNDLVITSSDVVETGAIVLAKGNLTLDKDFGSGYKYDVIIEGASLKAE